MPTSTQPRALTRKQEAELRTDVAIVEDKLHNITISMQACYGQDNQVAIRADETLCALQRFKWEWERVQMKTSAAGG